jgi:hypothetical protein
MIESQKFQLFVDAPVRAKLDNTLTRLFASVPSLQCMPHLHELFPEASYPQDFVVNIIKFFHGDGTIGKGTPVELFECIVPSVKVRTSCITQGPSEEMLRIQPTLGHSVLKKTATLEILYEP